MAAKFGWSVFAAFASVKHMRGTWLHRDLGDRLFVREKSQPERGRFAFGAP
jgi:hypothetical protein